MILNSNKPSYLFLKTIYFFCKNTTLKCHKEKKTVRITNVRGMEISYNQ